MRIILPLRSSGFVLAAFLFALLALLPLRFALDLLAYEGLGLNARAATGSVWRGVLREARVGPVSIGDVRTRLNLFPLLIGRARLTLASSAPDGAFEVAVTRSRGSFGFDDLTGRFTLTPSASPLAFSSLETSGLSGTFSNGRCVRASGRIRANATARAVALGFPAWFAGTARCAGEALRLPLASQTGAERFDIRLFADGRYQIDLAVRPVDPTWAARLAAAGFRPSGRDYTMRIRGEF